MRQIYRFRQFLLLGLSLLSACAAAGAAGSQTAGDPVPDPAPAGLYSQVLVATVAGQEGDEQVAARNFLAALAQDPTNRELQTQAFLACLITGRPEAARIAQQLPDNPIAQLLLGDLDAQAGNWAGAEQRYHGLPRQGVTEVLGPLLTAWAEQGAGNTDAALATLRPFVEGGRYRAVYALHAGMIADLAGRTADADRLYHLAETGDGGANLRLGQVLASWQARQGHKAEALRILDTVLNGSPDLALSATGLAAAVDRRVVRSPADGIAETYLVLAAALQVQDANDFAALLLHLALGMRPDFAPARLLLSDIQSASKHPAEALATLAPIPATDPLINVVRLRRALLEQDLGQTEEAMRALDQLARDAPDRPEPYEAQGDILRSKDRFAEAAAAYDHAIARMPDPGRGDWRIFYDRGIALERSHQWERAEADFQHALALAPDEPFVLNYLGYSWADQGRNLTRARQMIERAVQLRPNDGAIIDSLGWVQFRQGERATAVRTLEHAVELDPEDPTVNGHLGDAYWAVGRHQEALFQWRRALSLHPEPDDAAKLEAKLHEQGSASIPASTGTAAVPPTIQ